MSMTTKQVQAEAIQAAKNKGWAFYTEGDDYTACVITHHPDTDTNWCRVMTIVDGISQTVSEQCLPTVFESDYITTQLDTFKLTTQIY